MGERLHKRLIELLHWPTASVGRDRHKSAVFWRRAHNNKQPFNGLSQTVFSEYTP